ncbi:AAA family ATPase [Solirhodobacter olei]|uniref:AAA family ATPase n=1 Tax=Solirhodobacter olei TaxID=2493082 RepID=UPI000FD83091|nr:AAA family ATPase [Solirhodobacter olei]
MAVYYFEANVVSASTGASAVWSAAYRHATSMTSLQKSVERDYSRKADELVHEEIILPPDAPAWARERYGSPDVARASERLWNDIEGREAQSSRARVAQFARSLTIALPVELGRAERVTLMREYLTSTFAARGMVVDWVIHDIPENPHAHVMLSLRRLEEEGWGLKERGWNAREFLVDWRRSWADFANMALERAGHEARIDHRTLGEQGIELAPESFSPYVAAHAEAAGVTARGKERAEAARIANRDYLLARPEHILVVLSAKKTVFSAEDIRKELAKRLNVTIGGQAHDLEPEAFGDVLDRVLGARELVQMEEVGPRGEALFSTRSQQLVEARMLQQAIELAGKTVPLAEGQGAEALSENLNKGQAAAVRAMVAPEALTLVTGHAGTGKTFAIAEAARVWQERGFEVLGGAISGKAAQELDGIVGLKAASLAAWESRWANGQVPEGPFVFFMDEAGMVGSNSWARVQAHIADMGGKLIAVGDAEQLQPVSAGSAFKVIQDKIGSAVIDFVRRQTDPLDRLATHDLAMGGKSVGKALWHYQAQKKITFQPSASHAVEAIVEHYFTGDALESRIALAHRNADVDALNRELRAEAIRLGVVDPESVQQYPRPQAADLLEAAEPRPPLELGQGDRVRFTRPEREASVQRSAFGTVLAATPPQIVVAVDGRDDPVTLDPAKFLDLDYGYAATIHKSQGMTVDRAFVLGSETLNQHLLYVALSRHRDHVELHMPFSKRVTGMADLIAIGQRKGYMTLTDGLDGFDPKAPLPSSVRALFDQLPELARRADVVASAGPSERSSQVDDVELVQVATRTAGLLSADFVAGQSPLTAEAGAAVAAPQAVVEDLLAHRSAITAEDVARAISREVRDPETFVRLFFEAMAHPDLVAIERGGSRGDKLYTTAAQVLAEAALADRGARLAMRPDARAIPFAARDYSLNAAQRAALGEVLQGRRLSILTGGPGSGVTWTLGAIHHAYARAQWDVIGVAATGRGVDALRSIAGLDPMTATAFADRVSSGSLHLGPRSVVLVDQAERLGVRALDRLAEAVEIAGARLVLASSAPDQDPLEAGAGLRLLSSRLGAAELTVLERQRDPADRLAAELLFAGGAEARQAVAHYIAAGQVVAAERSEQAITALAEGFVRDPASDKLALALSRADATALNQAIRAAFRAEIPEAERPAEQHYERGEGQGALVLAAGDKISFARGLSEVGLRAGAQAEVIEAREDAAIVGIGAGEARQLLRLTPADLAGADYAWATTIHRAPSEGVVSVHVLAEGGLDRASAQRAFTRHTDSLAIYVPRGEGRAQEYLSDLVTRERPSHSAFDAITDKTDAIRAAFEASEKPERRLLFEPARRAVGEFLERVGARLEGAFGRAQVHEAPERTLDSLARTLIDRAMVPYDAVDDAFRRDPAVFSRLVDVDVAGRDPGATEQGRDHQMLLRKAFELREGRAPSKEERAALDREAAVLTSPTFYRGLVAPLSPEQRAEVRRLTRELAKASQEMDYKQLPPRTRNRFAVYVALDAAGKHEARDLYGRMLTETSRYILAELGKDRGVKSEMVRDVIEQRKELSIGRDAALGRGHGRTLQQPDHDKGGIDFGF